MASRKALVVAAIGLAALAMARKLPRKEEGGTPPIDAKHYVIPELRTKPRPCPCPGPCKGCIKDPDDGLIKLPYVVVNTIVRKVPDKVYSIERIWHSLSWSSDVPPHKNVIDPRWSFNDYFMVVKVDGDLKALFNVPAPEAKWLELYSRPVSLPLSWWSKDAETGEWVMKPHRVDVSIVKSEDWFGKKPRGLVRVAIKWLPWHVRWSCSNVTIHFKPGEARAVLYMAHRLYAWKRPFKTVARKDAGKEEDVQVRLCWIHQPYLRIEYYSY